MDFSKARVQPDEGWITLAEFARLHDVPQSYVQSICSGGLLPVDAVKKVPYRATGAWVIREDTPCPERKRYVRKAPPTRKKAGRRVVKPEPGDGIDGRESFIPKLRAVLESLSENPGSDAARRRLFKILIKNLGMGEVAKRFGLKPPQLEGGLTTTALESKAMLVGREMLREVRKSLRDHRVSEKKGGFVMPKRRSA